MGVFQTIGDAREYFSADRFAMQNGITIDELADGRCVCSMELTEVHRNASGSVMGGVIFTLADFALAVASNHIHRLSVAQSVDIQFLGRSRGTRLTAEAVCRKDGKRIGVYNISVADEFGTDVAQCCGTVCKL